MPNFLEIKMFSFYKHNCVSIFIYFLKNCISIPYYRVRENGERPDYTATSHGRDILLKLVVLPKDGAHRSATPERGYEPGHIVDLPHAPPRVSMFTCKITPGTRVVLGY